MSITPMQELQQELEGLYLLQKDFKDLLSDQGIVLYQTAEKVEEVQVQVQESVQTVATVETTKKRRFIYYITGGGGAAAGLAAGSVGFVFGPVVGVSTTILGGLAGTGAGLVFGTKIGKAG